MRAMRAQPGFEARGPSLRFEGRVAKAGRTISVVEGRALQFGIGGSGEVRVATMMATTPTAVWRGGMRA